MAQDANSWRICYTIKDVEGVQVEIIQGDEAAIQRAQEIKRAEVTDGSMKLLSSTPIN